MLHVASIRELIALLIAIPVLSGVIEAGNPTSTSFRVCETLFCDCDCSLFDSMSVKYSQHVSAQAPNFTNMMLGNVNMYRPVIFPCC